MMKRRDFLAMTGLTAGALAVPDLAEGQSRRCLSCAPQKIQMAAPQFAQLSIDRIEQRAADLRSLEECARATEKRVNLHFDFIVLHGAPDDELFMCFEADVGGKRVRYSPSLSFDDHVRILDGEDVASLGAGEIGVIPDISTKQLMTVGLHFDKERSKLCANAAWSGCEKDLSFFGRRRREFVVSETSRHFHPGAPKISKFTLLWRTEDVA
jgi:hypothetical protein